MKKILQIFIATFLLLTALSMPSYAEIMESKHESSNHIKNNIRANRNSEIVPVKGLTSWSKVIRDNSGIAHISSVTQHDMYFMQGFIHAQDRLFQMDFSRRQASGTLSELLGSEALPSDVEFRTIGVRRAAERSWEALSNKSRKAILAYTKGVNAYIANHQLPPEYDALELRKFTPWVPVDCVAIGKLISFGLSFDTGDISRSLTLGQYQAAGVAFGFDGAALFFEDIVRSAPFDSASTLLDSDIPRRGAGNFAHLGNTSHSLSETFLNRSAAELGRRYLSRVNQIPFFEQLNGNYDERGSNEWAISGRHTVNGFPLLANDPHLSLDTPSTFYPMHIGHLFGSNAVGNTFPGIPSVVLGHNRHISWGATTNPLDVTDAYFERITVDPASPSGFSTVFQEQLEHIIPIPETYYVNQIDNSIFDDVIVVAPGEEIPEFTLIVPRRNMGPIVELDLETMTALSIQYSGFSATREIDAFIEINSARNLKDFEQALSYLDFGSQNFVYSDVQGNIAYFSTAELPLREDLNAGVINGLPPSFIRSGSGGNEWLALKTPQKNQALPYEILPTDEMPHIVNPDAGWFVNANNDPTGSTLDNNPYNQLRENGGVYYLSPGYARGFRAGRITQLIKEKLNTGDKKISFQEMEEIQNDVVLLDAQFFVPFISQALENANQFNVSPELNVLANNASLAEAVTRLRDWKFTTPTGIEEGYDNNDINGILSPVSEKEAVESVATTIYSLWRSQFINNAINATLNKFELTGAGSSFSLVDLRVLLENFNVGGGIGKSGLNFFEVTGVESANDRRDIIILQSLVDALELLRGETFASAFNFSDHQDDYRWGKLHRIVFDSPLGEPFSIPSEGTDFPPPLAGLRGIPTDGGFGVVDASSHRASAQAESEFMYTSGPVNRFVSEQKSHSGITAVSIWPGGTSGIIGSKNYFNLLPIYLTNDRIPVLYQLRDIKKNAESVSIYVPQKER